MMKDSYAAGFVAKIVLAFAVTVFPIVAGHCIVRDLPIRIGDELARITVLRWPVSHAGVMPHEDG